MAKYGPRTLFPLLAVDTFREGWNLHASMKMDPTENAIRSAVNTAAIQGTSVAGTAAMVRVAPESPWISAAVAVIGSAEGVTNGEAIARFFGTIRVR